MYSRSGKTFRCAQQSSSSSSCRVFLFPYVVLLLIRRCFAFLYFQLSGDRYRPSAACGGVSVYFLRCLYTFLSVVGFDHIRRRELLELRIALLLYSLQQAIQATSSRISEEEKTKTRNLKRITALLCYRALSVTTRLLLLLLLLNTSIRIRKLVLAAAPGARAFPSPVMETPALGVSS